MVRVPNTVSLRGLSRGWEDVSAPESPLHTMSDREADEFVTRCAAALRSHGRDFHAGQDKENALAAFESIVALLLEIRDIQPARRADIDRVLSENGYPIPEN